MGKVLHRGLLQGLEPVGVDASVHHELAEVWGFCRKREILVMFMGSLPGDVSEEPVTLEKRKKGWENEL